MQFGDVQLFVRKGLVDSSLQIMEYPYQVVLNDSSKEHVLRLNLNASDLGTD